MSWRCKVTAGLHFKAVDSVVVEDFEVSFVAIEQDTTLAGRVGGGWLVGVDDELATQDFAFGAFRGERSG